MMRQAMPRKESSKAAKRAAEGTRSTRGRKFPTAKQMMRPVRVAHPYLQKHRGSGRGRQLRPRFFERVTWGDRAGGYGYLSILILIFNNTTSTDTWSNLIRFTSCIMWIWVTGFMAELRFFGVTPFTYSEYFGLCSLKRMREAAC
jgi:hypothetical protein